MLNLLEFTEAWKELKSLLDKNDSGVLIGPRHYGKWSALKAYAETSAGPKLRWAALSSRVPPVHEDMDYPAAWSTLAGQLDLNKEREIEDRSSFLEFFESALKDANFHIMLLIDGAGRGYEEDHYRFVATFHRLLRTGKLTIATTDDYSSFYFHKENFLWSDLNSLKSVQVGPATQEEIGGYLREAMASDKHTFLNDAAERIYERSGGHIGIAQDILRGLQRESWPALGPTWEQRVDEILRRSFVLESIDRALEEDAEGYSHTALEYRTPAPPEHNSPRVHVLRQLGVLQRADTGVFRLCGGAITKLMEALHRRTKAEGRIGTIISEAGPRIFEEGTVELNDDDIVVLHLSDLHVGEKYRHRFSWPGNQMNTNEHSAGELLREDLQALRLLGRVDAIVMSGDFVWNGTPTEFLRAEAVVQEILTETKLDSSKAIFIPGNHDLEWNPGTLGSSSYGKAASRESFDMFLRLLGKTPQGEVGTLDVLSRSKQVRLRILGLDSNRVEGPEAAGIGFVSRDALELMKKAVADSFPDPSSESKGLTWMVVHHHIFPATSAPLADAQGRAVSVMANAAEVLDYANRCRVELILHGHEHQPSVTVARRWPIDVGEAFAPIATIGAGSFGVKRDYLGPFSRNQYYILIRRAQGILIRSRCQGSGGISFIPHSDMWLPRQ